MDQRPCRSSCDVRTPVSQWSGRLPGRQRSRASSSCRRMAGATARIASLRPAKASGCDASVSAGSDANARMEYSPGRRAPAGCPEHRVGPRRPPALRRRVAGQARSAPERQWVWRAGAGFSAMSAAACVLGAQLRRGCSVMPARLAVVAPRTAWRQRANNLVGWVFDPQCPQRRPVGHERGTGRGAPFGAMG